MDFIKKNIYLIYGFISKASNKYIDLSSSQIGTILELANRDLCIKLYLIICLLLIHISVFYIFIKCLAYSVYFIYYRITLIFRENPSLYHSPLFAQINDFTYYNKYFSYETYTIRYLFCVLLTIIGLSYLYYKNVQVSVYYNYIIIFIIIVSILIIAYILINIVNIIRINNILNNLNKLIYDNLNIEMLPDFCDYTENKKNSVDFMYGQCNNLKNDKHMLWEYINLNIVQLQQKYPDYISSYSEIILSDPNKWKKDVLLKCVDDNNVSYYNKILRAMVTFSLINYFIENNLRYEANEFFGIYNTINTNILEEFLKKRINPFLYLKLNNLILLNYTYTENKLSNLHDTFFTLLRNDYDEIKDELTNGIIETHDLFNYSIIPAGYIYIAIAIECSGLIYAKAQSYNTTTI